MILLTSLLSTRAALGMTATALAMVLTPGPNMIYLVSRSVGQGRRAGLVSLAGTALGFVIYLLLANAGMATVFVAVPWLYVGFKAVGVCYLAHLTWRAMRPGGEALFQTRDLPPESDVRLFRMGLATNLLNPKTAIMYLTLIPQFLHPERGNLAAQGLCLGGLQICVSVAVNAAIVWGAGSVASFLAGRPRWATWQQRATGTMLGAVTLLLAREVPTRARI